MPANAEQFTEVLKVCEEATSNLDVRELACSLVNQFGGMSGFTAQFYAEYTQAKGIAKQRMLEAVLRVVTAAGSKGGQDEVSVATDEELLEFIKAGAT